MNHSIKSWRNGKNESNYKDPGARKCRNYSTLHLEATNGSGKEEIARQECITRQQEENHPNLDAQDCGLFISEHDHWLAVTRDGIVHDPAHPPGLLEIKNPYSVRDKDFTEACKVSSFCLEEDKESNTYKLKLKHDYYYQIQCQLLRQHTLVRLCGPDQ